MQVVGAAQALGAAAPGAASELDLSAFTGAPPTKAAQLEAGMFSRPQPYEQRRWALGWDCGRAEAVVQGGRTLPQASPA